MRDISNINRDAIDNLLSSSDEGVYLNTVEPGSTMHVRTESRTYTLVLLGNRDALVSGHPDHCPIPVRVRIQGSTWGGSLLKIGFVGKGMRLEYWHPEYHRVTTSPILDLRLLEGTQTNVWQA